MAQVPYQGSPDSQAPTDLPNVYQHVDTSPQTFGGAVAEGLGAAGEGALDAAKFYGQAAAADGANNVADAANNIMHGQPGKLVPGPDGGLVQDSGFLGLRGADAMRAYPDAVQSLDEAIRDQREGLTTPAARLQFDNDTRRMRAAWLAQMGGHNDQQQITWYKNTNENQITTNLNSVSLNAADDNAISPYVEKVRQGYVRLAQLDFGQDEDAAKGAILKADQQIALTRFRKLIADPSTAQDGVRVLDQAMPVLGSLPEIDALRRQGQNAVFEATSGPALNNFVTGQIASAQKLVGTNAPGQDYSALPFAQIKDRLQAGEGPPRLGGYSAQAYNTSATTNAVGLKPVDLTRMTIGQVLDYQHNVMTPATVDHRGPNDPGTTAVGAYQFERGTLQAQAQATLGPHWRDQPFSPANQDLMAEHLYNSVRGNPDTLAKTWPSLAGGDSGGGYPTLADAMNANRLTMSNQLQDEAERLYPGHPDQQDRFVTMGERRYDQQIIQQTRMDEVNSHVVQSWVAQNNPISTQEIMNGPPEVRAAFDAIQRDAPEYAINLDRMLDANSRGRATGNGSQIYGYLNRALAAHDDPNRITNPGQLGAFVGKDANAPLTNTGAGMLTDLIGIRGTPQGEATAGAIKGWVDAMHGQLTYTNTAAGIYDAKGEQAFDKVMSATMPIILKAAKAGNVNALLDPKSPDYIGKVALNFSRTPAQIVRDRLSSEGITGNGNDNPMTPLGLQMAVMTKQITPEEAVWIAGKMGFPPPKRAATPKLLIPNPVPNASPLPGIPMAGQ